MNTQRWEQRFRAPSVGMPMWGAHAPDRLVYNGTESGVWQAHVIDLVSGRRRKVTDHPVGVIDAQMTPDGRNVAWFIDENGDESGRWWSEPFEGGEPLPLLSGVPERGWNNGLAQTDHVIAAAIGTQEEFALFVSRDGAPATKIWSSTEAISLGGSGEGAQPYLGGLSADGSLVAVEHGEGSDEIHRGLRVFDTTTGAVAGDVAEHGISITGTCWSPVPGDQRLAYVHERRDFIRPAIWNVETGDHRDLVIDAAGDHFITDWWPDESKVLVARRFEGSFSLFSYDLATEAMIQITAEPGQYSGERVRPDGSVWYRVSTGARQARILSDAGAEVVPPQGDPAPAGRPYESWHFTNPQGEGVHGFFVHPEGEGPWPVMMYVHGGPTWLHEDRFEPEVQSYVDAGFLVGMVNYRGSTGYGRGWRDRIIGDIGGCDLEDVNAGFDDLVTRGIADPTRAVVAGWSWGGYVTLMMMGKHAERWTCGMAGVPVGDYELGYEALSPDLKAYDRALLGGTPDQVPELMADRNPINHADKVSAPVLFVIGENDSRCPYEQAMAYVNRLAARNSPHQVYLFGTGHGSNDVDEDVHQQRVILDFLLENVKGLTTV
ncbi:MAG: prolyl oligopeptidase family serine peptidase [Actinomycetota bacterium]